jgi:anti-anti-sigma factor
MESGHTVTYKDEVIRLELTGHLDATNAEGVMAELKNLVGRKVVRLVFMAKDLEYISSAGLRVILFAKQRVGIDAQMFLIGAPDPVLNVIRMSGLDNFMTIQDNDIA